MKKLLCLFLLSIFSLSQVHAHPHAWTRLKLEVINEPPANLKINSRDYGDKVVYPTFKLQPNHTAIYGLLFTMELDAISSAPVIVEVKRGLDSFWAEIATNMVENKFFTLAKLNGLNPSLAKEIEFAHAVSMVDIKVNEQNRVEVIYFAPFKSPVILSEKDYIMLQTYDPSYYIDMSYESYKSITFSAKTKPECQAGLEQASPDAALVDYATSLPADAQPNDPNIGQYFTQTLYIGCPYTP